MFGATLYRTNKVFRLSNLNEAYHHCPRCGAKSLKKSLDYDYRYYNCSKCGWAAQVKVIK